MLCFRGCHNTTTVNSECLSLGPFASRVSSLAPLRLRVVSIVCGRLGLVRRVCAFAVPSSLCPCSPSVGLYAAAAPFLCSYKYRLYLQIYLSIYMQPFYTHVNKYSALKFTIPQIHHSHTQTHLCIIHIVLMGVCVCACILIWMYGCHSRGVCLTNIYYIQTIDL